VTTTRSLKEELQEETTRATTSGEINFSKSTSYIVSCMYLCVELHVLMRGPVCTYALGALKPRVFAVHVLMR